MDRYSAVLGGLVCPVFQCLLSCLELDRGIAAEPDQNTFDEFLEDLAIQGACGGRFGMELAPNNKPVIQSAFDPFNDPVLTSRGDFEGIGQAVDGHVVSAVDPNFTLSVDSTEDRLRFDDQGVAVIWIVGI